MPKPPISPEGPFNCHQQFKTTKPGEKRLQEIAEVRRTNPNVILRALIDEEWARCCRSPANDTATSPKAPRELPPDPAPRRLVVELDGPETERLDWLRSRAGLPDDGALIRRWIEEHVASATAGRVSAPTLASRARHLADLVRRTDPDSPAGRRLLVHLPHWPETMIAARQVHEALDAAADHQAGGAPEATEEALRGAVYRLPLAVLEGFADLVGDRLAELRRGAGAEVPAASTPREAARRAERAKSPATAAETLGLAALRMSTPAAAPIHANRSGDTDRYQNAADPRSEKAAPAKTKKFPRLKFDERVELQALVDTGGAQEGKTERQRRYWRWMADGGSIAKRFGGPLTERGMGGWKATTFGEEVLAAHQGTTRS
jgi:hypothetical protein